jgi:branched-chain amino acid transport system ATP-binding protein
LLILKVEDVTKKFGAFSALNEASLNVPEKRIDLLIGPNGSGKTTLLNCISGVFPYEGEIYFDKVGLSGEKPWEIVNLGIGRTFQIPAPFKRLTVAENLLMSSKLHPGESFSRCLFVSRWREHEQELLKRLYSVLDTIELRDRCNVLASDLSGGQLKLLELGRLLMLGCRLVLLDEPIGGVNPTLAHKLLSQVREIRDRFATTFLIVEHRLDIAMQYAESVHVMSGGKVVQEGSPREILDSEFYRVYL